MSRRYLGSFQVSETLVVEAWTGDTSTGVLIAREAGGLVGLHPQEIQPLVEALNQAAGALAEAEAGRAGADPAGDGDG